MNIKKTFTTLIMALFASGLFINGQETDEAVKTKHIFDILFVQQ